MRIRALSVTNNGDGTVSLELPSREMTKEESKVLDKLFPTSTHEIEKLLEREALFAAMDVDGDEVRTPTTFYNADGCLM